MLRNYAYTRSTEDLRHVRWFDGGGGSGSGGGGRGGGGGGGSDAPPVAHP